MIWFILCVPAAIYGYYENYHNNYYRNFLEGFLESMGEALIYSMMTCFICVIINLFCCMSIGDKDVIPVISSSTNICALQDNMKTNGTFFLGSGEVSSNLYYFYAEETDRGVKIDKISQSNCYIKYTNKQPHIDYISNKIVGWKKNLTFFEESDGYYVIYVPKGTIDTSYNIDLK